MFYKVLVTSMLLIMCKGQIQLQYAHPPGGTVIGHLEGESQFIITCNVTNSGSQTTTVWSIRNWNGVTGLMTISEEEFPFLSITGDPRLDDSTLVHYGNHLTIVQFIVDLDGVTLYCGSGGQTLAEYPVKLYVSPSKPQNLVITGEGATWVTMSWEPPIERGSPEVTRYEVTTEKFNSTNEQLIVEDTNTRLTMSNETLLNVTGLLPNTIYVFSVIARSEVKGEVVSRSNASQTVSQTTLATASALICRNIPNISVGETTTITVSWSYNHKGGLPLTNLSVQHTILDIDTMEQALTMTDYLIDTDVTSLNVYNVLPGYKYRFRVTATNAKGSTSVYCPLAVIDILTFQVVLWPIQDCESWVMSSTTAKIREITKHIQRNIISRCNCTFLQQQIFNQTLQCSHQSAIFRAHLLELHSQQHIPQITAWILTNPNITIDEVRYGLNSDCPVTISSHDAPLTECGTQHPTDGTGIDQTILLVVILASVLGILFLVVVICLVVVCCMCCDTNNLIKSRATNTIEVELSAWNVEDIPMRESSSVNEANDYEVVADVITNPMYRAVARGKVVEPQKQEDTPLQLMYDTPNAS